jgi:hypothetical protein
MIELCRQQGLGLLNPNLSRIRLSQLVLGEDAPCNGDYCPSTKHRSELEAFVLEHAEILEPQLPLCKGRCVSHGCPIGVALSCFHDNRRHLQ